jgi:peptide-methionine (R)-S-oxide reductase
MNLKNVCLSILIILGFIFAFIMKKSLSQDQINILNHKGTEPAFSGDLLYNKEKGTYLCVGCDNVLFSSENKFDSGSGWPSFSETNNIKSIKTKTDLSYGMTRTEVICYNCGGHLGHVFDDGPTVSKKRYCINSKILKFQKK